MIHTSMSTHSAVAFIVAGIATVLLLSGHRRPWYGYPYQPPVFGKSVATGLVAAVSLTEFLDTRRHAALIRNAASAHLSAGYTLACGFVITFVIVTVTALIILSARSR
jgi:hypothetical protein